MGRKFGATKRRYDKVGAIHTVGASMGLIGICVIFGLTRLFTNLTPSPFLIIVTVVTITGLALFGATGLWLQYHFVPNPDDIQHPGRSQ